MRAPVCLLLLCGCVASTRTENTTPPRILWARASAAMTPWLEIGYSLGDRPIYKRIVGTGSRKVLWIGGIHGNEREGHVATERLSDAFVSETGLAEEVTLVMIRDMNPDGSARGTRGNARGVDLNRNFPAKNFEPGRRHGQSPLDQPESRLLHEMFVQLDPDLVIVVHSTNRGPFINFDGPSLDLARRFSALSGYRVVPSNKLHRTPGSLGSWVGVDRRTAILTLEYRKGQDAGLAWEQTREAILAVIRGS